MFSDLTETQLVQEWDGFDATLAVPFSDNNDATRLWSELNNECEPVEISLFGLYKGSPEFIFFERTVFKARGEGMDLDRYTGFENMDGLVTMLQWTQAGIGILGLRYVLSAKDSYVIRNLSTVKLRSTVSAAKGDEFIDPGLAALDHGAYDLADGLYLNIANESSVMERVRPFIDFGLSEEGTDILIDQGFWPLDHWERLVMKTRVQTSSGIPLAYIQENCGPAQQAISMAGSSTVDPVAKACTCALGAVGVRLR